MGRVASDPAVLGSVLAPMSTDPDDRLRAIAVEALARSAGEAPPAGGRRAGRSEPNG